MPLRLSLPNKAPKLAARNLLWNRYLPQGAPLLRAVPRIAIEQGFPLNISTPRENYDLLKATIHHLSRLTDLRRQAPNFLAQIAWVAQVTPAKGAKLHERLTAALLTTENT
ncbi:MAG: hypothetical protein U1A24_06740 [Cypionkella sp.]|uniref:hypothetical protein n=1 Tax=Cypionkella sp. TaxID=2811411 RepID=UPI002AB831F5|nr:hypothetical protein [Cypionkella sp.]MDZ4310237.1 hypothetical protein [Cypionkella sp.]MDZ4392451.1 hypothetical protein [Cypionkella sp.]